MLNSSSIEMLKIKKKKKVGGGGEGVAKHQLHHTFMSHPVQIGPLGYK